MTDRPPTDPGLPSGCRFNDRIIAAFGEDGKNGRVGALEKAVKEMKMDISGIKAVQLKLIIWVSIAAGGSSAAATAAFKIFT